MATKKPAPAGGSPAQLQKLLASAQSLATAFAALGLPSVTAEERLHSNGRLRVGEAAAITSIFDAMDAFPGVFGALAAKDLGSDPTKVETDVPRAALAQAVALGPLSAALEGLTQQVSDTVLALASEAKEVSVPAYAIGKASAASDPKVAKAMATAIGFYGQSARTRVASKKIASAKAAKAKSAPKQ